MRKKVSLIAGVVTALLIATVVVSCDDSTGPNRPTYTATLNAANEVTPISTAAGTGVTTLVDNGSQIDWTMSLTNMSTVTVSHVHGPAPATANASVIINLFMPNGATGTLNGVVASGTITNANNANVSLDSLRTLFNNGNAYVNVHTSAFPGGAIRGQVVRN